MRSIRSLTALRTFPSILVVIAHSRGILLPSGYMEHFPFEATVTFFFVLSGFILTWVYTSEADGMKLRPYYAARFARIWPTILLAFVLALCVLPTSFYLPNLHLHPSAWVRGASMLTFVTQTQAWVPTPQFYFAYDPAAWSVSVEVGFYLALPFVLRMVFRSWLWTWLATLGVGLLMLVTVDALSVPSFESVPLDHISAHAFFYINPIPRAKEFVTGMVVGVAVARLPNRSPRRGWRTALEVFVLLLAAIGLRYVAPLVSYPLNDTMPATSAFLRQTINSMFFAAVIFIFYFEAGFVSRLLTAKPLVLVGEASLSLYLLHQVALTAYLKHQWLLSWCPSSLRFLVALTVLCTIATISWRWFEVPIRSRVRARLSSPRRGRHQLVGKGRPNLVPPRVVKGEGFPPLTWGTGSGSLGLPLWPAEESTFVGVD